ncbi:hypothetical protein, partial [Escherichia coli]|uniref:hypothetical protein n=1 Tax=Escherichia coli TaxID=562 RepID=UPI0019256796
MRRRTFVALCGPQLLAVYRRVFTDASSNSIYPSNDGRAPCSCLAQMLDQLARKDRQVIEMAHADAQQARRPGVGQAHTADAHGALQT